MAKSMMVENGVDRISALPDELLCHILSYIPTKLAVCTSVLSTRWRCLYTLVSNLDFVTDTDFSVADVEKSNRFMNFVERVLLLRTRPVERFSLRFNHHIDPLCMDGWVRALICRNIQELDFCIAFSTGIGSYSLQLPASLFSCKTLVTLKLSSDFDCHMLNIPTRVSLPSLKVLHMGRIVSSCSNVERLLSSCPVLDDLVLGGCIAEADNNQFMLNISIAALKRLTLRCVELYPGDQIQQIIINCPALVHLNCYFMSERYNVVLVAAETLATVVIGVDSEHPPGYVNAHDLFRQIKNTQSLQVQDFIIQDPFNQNLPLPLFNNLTYLKVCDCVCLFDSRWLEYLLAPCVVLETLVLERRQFPEHSAAQSTRIQHLLHQSRLTSLLCHLKTIEIELLEIKEGEIRALMKMIEFFLINAKVLEKLYVSVISFSDTVGVKITKAAATLPRVSKKCQVLVKGGLRGAFC